LPRSKYTNANLGQSPVTGPFGFPLRNNEGSENEIRVAKKSGRYTLAIKADNAWRYFDENLKVATASTLGAMKVGSGLAITGDGTLSATGGGGGGSGDITGVTLTSDSGTASDTTANVDLTIAGGNAIGTTATGTTVTINHTDTSSQASVDNSGRTYIQDITLDTYGHITAITSATESVTNTDVDVSVANLKTRLAGGFGSNAVTIGDSDDVVTIAGNLVVSGTYITADVETISVEDPLIQLAKANPADLLDVGFYAKYVDSGTKYTGLFRDASDSDKWKLFDSTGNSHEAPTTTVNTTSGFALGYLIAATFEGALVGNATTATTATNVTVADESSDTTCFPLFSTAATGNLPPKSGTNLTFNSNTGMLTATGFTGPLTGTASKTTVTDSTADTAFAVVFHDGSDALLDDTGTLTYNPNDGAFTAHTLKIDASSTSRIYVANEAGGTTPSVGTSGQAIISYAASGAPYWGNPIPSSSGSEGRIQLSGDSGVITSSSYFGFGALDASPLVLTYAGNMNITGAFEVKNGSTSAGYINFYEDSSNGTNKVTLIGPASTADITLTLPSAAGTIIGTGNSTSITSVGTITAGVWNSSTVIASAYLDADTAHLSGTQTFSGAKTFSSNLTLAANLVITGYKITANTSAGAGAGVGTAGNALLSYGAGGGVYWGTPTSGPAGSTEHVQYNASGAMAGEANFKWEYAENNLAIDGTIGVTGAVTWASGGSANANTAYTHSQVSGGVHATDWSTLALGATSSTAYRGDRGTTAYDHSQTSHAPSGAEANVSGNSGNAAVYDNGGTPTLKSGITAAEMRTAIGAGTSSLVVGTSGGTALEGDTTIISLGSTSSTAHRGDHGATAYTHSQASHAPSDANNYTLPSTVIHESELSNAVDSTSTTTGANVAGVKLAYDRAWATVDHAHNASTLTGSTLASGVTASSLTSVGTLTSLTSSGDITTSADKRLSIGTWDNAAFSGSAMYGLSITSSAPIVHLAESDESGKKAYFGMSGGSAYLGGNSITSLVFQTGSGTSALTLDSSQNATFAGAITSSHSTTGAAAATISNTHADGLGLYVRAASGTNRAFNIRDYTNGNDLFYVRGNGDVAIGATKKLYLDGGGNSYISEIAGDDIDIVAGGNQSIQVRGINTTFAGAVTVNNSSHSSLTINSPSDATAAWTYYKQNGTLRWATGREGNSTNYQIANGSWGVMMDMEQDGDVKFAGKVDIIKDIGGFIGYIYNDNGTGEGLNIKVKSNDAGQTGRYLIKAEGYGSSGAFTNNFLVDIDGNATFAGTVNAGADVVAYYSSDPTLKENKELISNPLDKIDSIGGYSFDWKESAEEYAPHLKGHDYGVMADEIQELFPELVQTRDNGIRAVKYDKLVPLLIEGIKELKTEINQLKGIV
jgi:hypothetical protein